MEEEQRINQTHDLYDERNLCKRCRNNPIDRSENPQSVLCRECREELIKLKVPPVIVGIGIGVAVVVLLCIAMFTVDIMRGINYDHTGLFSFGYYLSRGSGT